MTIFHKRWDRIRTGLKFISIHSRTVPSFKPTATGSNAATGAELEIGPLPALLPIIGRLTAELPLLVPAGGRDNVGGLLIDGAGVGDPPDGPVAFWGGAFPKASGGGRGSPGGGTKLGGSMFLY